MRRFEKGVG